MALFASLPRNDDEVVAYFTYPLKNVAKYIADKIWEENRELVQTMIYDSGRPKWYQRTYEFRDKAWKTEVPENPSDKDYTAEARLYFDSSALTVDREKAQHGSPEGYEPYRDVRPYLAEILYRGLSGDLFGDGYWRQERDVWDKLNKSLGKRKLSKWLVEGMNKYGMEVERYAAREIPAYDV